MGAGRDKKEKHFVGKINKIVFAGKFSTNTNKEKCRATIDQLVPRGRRRRKKVKRKGELIKGRGILHYIDGPIVFLLPPSSILPLFQ
jgi:hypothetical protein